MKKIYGLIGFAGFILLVGAAGGAQDTSVATSLILMLTGFCMLVSSEILIRRYDYRLRQKRIAAGRKLSSREIRRVSEPDTRVCPVYSTSAKKCERRIRVTSPEMC